MLNRDNFFKIIIIICFASCHNVKEKEINETTKFFKKTSESIITKYEYKNVYYLMNDSIRIWAKNNLVPYRIATEPFKIDSLLCFNKARNKVITALEYQYISELTDHDGIIFFYGLKIKDKWYFFNGASIHLPREYYQKDIHTPLSFEKLHEIAMNEVFNGYLKKKDKGFWNNLFGKTDWEINDDFFKEINHPRILFKERRTDSNTYFSCRELNDKKEYEDCFFRHEALAVWNEDSTSVNRDTYLYSPEFPVTKKLRQLKKGDLLRVIERIDNSDWCCVRMWDGNPNVGFIEKKTIVKLKKSSR